MSELMNLEDYNTFLSDEQVEAIQSFWNTFTVEKLSEQQKELP